METECKLVWTGMVLSVLMVLMTCHNNELKERLLEETDNFYVAMHLDQLDKQLGETIEDRNYDLRGLEVEGTYWWWCGDKWTQIEPPCPAPDGCIWTDEQRERSWLYFCDEEGNLWGQRWENSRYNETLKAWRKFPPEDPQ